VGNAALLRLRGTKGSTCRETRWNVMRLGVANSAIPRHWMNLHSNETYFWITLAPILSLTIIHTELLPRTLRLAGYIRFLLAEIYALHRNDFNSFLYRVFIEERINWRIAPGINNRRHVRCNFKGRLLKTSNLSNILISGKSGAFVLPKHHAA